MNINSPKPSAAFPIAPNPGYDTQLRQILDNDDAEASGLFNPLLNAMINNTHHVKLRVDGLTETVTRATAKVFGVQWDYNNTSTALTRLTIASDPHDFVTVNVASEPAPAIGNVAGSSPFDSYFPWAGIDEYNIVNGAVSFRRGETGFSRTANDTVVRIPAYYYFVEKDTVAKKMRFYISDLPLAGFALHPAFNRGDGVIREHIYVGKYNTGANYVTKSGLAPLVNITRPAARSGSANKGADWWQYDYAAWSAIWLLYLVEFADWNSQKEIGRGYVDGNPGAINTGGCDSMIYHTGRAAGTDGKTPVIYRWIENLWGNVWEWTDGLNVNERATYLCLNPANFADDTATNYMATGVTLPENGWIKELGFSPAFPFAFLPISNGGSETSYIGDHLWSNTGWRVFILGGSWDNGGNAGLFFFYADGTSSLAHADVGARLLFLP